MNRKTKLTTTLLFLTLLAVPAALAGESIGVLNLVHGIPGATVDVCASGDITEGQFIKVAESFEFKEIATLELPEGSYDAAVVLAGGDCETEALPGLSASGLFLPGGANVSVVARLAEDAMGFGLSVFVNEPFAGRFGNRLVVRHTAAAPTVDVRYGRRALNRVIPNLMFGMEQFQWVFPGQWRIALALPGETSPVLGPATIKIPNRTSTVVYAVGSAGGGTLDVIVQEID